MGRWSISEVRVNRLFFCIIFFFFSMIPAKCFIPFLSTLFEPKLFLDGSIYQAAVITFLTIFGLEFLKHASTRKEPSFLGLLEGKSIFSNMKAMTVWLIKSVKEYCFTSRNPIRDALIGACVGAIIYLSGFFRVVIFKGAWEPLITLTELMQLFREGNIVLLLIMVSLYKLIVAPLIEEILFRRVMISGIMRFKGGKIGALMSLLFSMMIFAYSHSFSPESKIISGLVLGILYLWKRNLYAPVFAHALYNLMVTLFPL
jgi:membrane protease YdiL (CAAX protease family)